MKLQPLTLQKELIISEIYSVHYFEFPRDFTFPGERHDFWEMAYVDKGKLLITDGEEETAAVSGDLFFFRPGQWHSLRGNGTTAANVMTLGFACSSRAMDPFGGRCLTPNLAQKSLLRDIWKESRASFASSLDDPSNHMLQRAKNAPFGSEQMIEMYMVELLISLRRRMQSTSVADKEVSSVPIMDAMIAYMEQNLSQRLTMDLLAEKFGISTSCVKRLFAQYKQTGAMHYFTMLKIEHAKKLLRQKDCNIAQIAELLGYESSNYFCNRFKKYTGMSPLEYRRSVNAFSTGKKQYG